MIFLGLLLLSSAALAESSLECMQDPGEVVTQVQEASGCFHAVEIAKACSFGTSSDVSIVESAINICLQETGKLSREDTRLYRSMNRRCNFAYGQPGSLYASLAAYCRLQAVIFIHDVVLAQ